jgi:SulP family sulfate permease
MIASRSPDREINRASRPHIAVLGRDQGGDRWPGLERHPDNEREPRIAVVRCESALFFANADAVRDTIHATLEADTVAVVLDAETVPAIDVTADSILTQLADDLRRDGVELVFARDVGVVELVRLGASDAPLPRYPTVNVAVDALRNSDRVAPIAPVRTCETPLLAHVRLVDAR